MCPRAQLESTLFGVLVLHIKPQLELLLNLPPDALTKEVALTQDLMDRASDDRGGQGLALTQDGG